jgi:transporter family-2 protein
VNWIIYVLAVLAGAANPAQAAANAELKKSLDQALVATIAVYFTGLIGMIVIQAVSRQPLPAVSKYSGAPWWAWTGGLISIAATLAGAAFAQRLGSGIFTGLSVTAAIVTSIVLDHYGWMGFKVHHATWPRILGCALMVAGLWLTSKF